MKFKPGKRVFLTRDRKRAVYEGDPRAASLLLGPDDEIDEAEAKRLGLMDTSREAAAALADAAASPPPPDDEAEPTEDVEAKAVSEPPEDKAVKPAENKAPEPQPERRAVPRRR